MLTDILPPEITDAISLELTVSDLLSVITVNSQHYERFIPCLHRRSRSHRSQRYKGHILTKGLESVTYWFDEGGTGSVLEWTILQGRCDTFRQILQVPCTDALQCDSFGTTLVHRTAGQGFNWFLCALVHHLKLTKKDPFQVDDSLLTPLHYAAGRGKSETVRLLIGMGADVSARDRHGNTPLHLAAVTGSHEVLKMLVHAGADVNTECRLGWRAIDQAGIALHDNSVKELRRLGSQPPSWQKRERPVEEFLSLSPCPKECYERII